MAKRYGRNQRRRHRQAFERLKDENYGLQIEAARLSEQIHDWDSRLSRLLSECSWLRSEIPKVAPGCRARYVPMMTVSEGLAAAVDPGPVPMTGMAERVFRFELMSERDLLRCQRLFHFVECNRDQPGSTYAISETALMELGMDDRAVVWLAKEISRDLIEGRGKA